MLLTKPMNLPEDRHPLLYVYLDDEKPDRVRSRCVSQGASTVLGKWPEYVTFSWMMGVVGIVSIFTCFLLAIVILMVSSSGHHHGKRALIGKCERNEHVIQLVHMKNLEDLTVDENATYFVEVVTDATKARDSACSVESYLKHTSMPVFLVYIFPNKSLENLTISNELEKKFNNFKTITFNLNSFFNRTVFANFQKENPKFLTFLAKILVSWNVGGTVIDSQIKTLGDVQKILKADDKSVTLGIHQGDLALISTKRFCHAYIFDVLKTIIETRSVLRYSEVEVMKKAKDRFCRGKWNCKSVKLVSSPEVCVLEDAKSGCTFFKSQMNEIQPPSNFTWNKLCPLVGAFI